MRWSVHGSAGVLLNEQVFRPCVTSGSGRLTIVASEIKDDGDEECLMCCG
jgi:hypothetical protein